MKKHGRKPKRIVKLWAAMLAITLVFGTTVIGCRKGSTASVGSVAGKTGGSGGGTFTITDIPSAHNGKYAFLEGGSGNVNDIFYGFESIDSSTNTIVLSCISDGKVSLPMWSRLIGFSRFSDSKTFDVWVNITNSSEIPPSGYSVETSVRFNSVKFLKGSATKSWKDGK